MAVNWGLLGRGYDAMQSLKFGLAAQQSAREQSGLDRLIQAGQQVASEVGAGNYRRAGQVAFASGNNDLVRSVASMGEADRKRASHEAGVLAAAAGRLRSLPVEQRETALGQLAPVLRRFGFGHDELASADLSDQGLDGYIAFGRSILDDTDARDEPSVIRSLRAVGIDPQSPEGRDIVTRSLAAPRYLQNGDGTFTVMGGAPSSPPAPAMQAASPPAAAIQALRTGQGSPEQFDEIFGAGAAARAMGGAPSQGGASFP